jgi:transcriptional regulator with GAF, ATPase, and Fis domain
VGDPARFEQLLADLSTRFAGVASERVDDEIDYALEQLVAFLDTDRSTFLELTREDGIVVVTHSWARPGVQSAATSMPVSGRFPWYHARLRRGEVLRFERVSDELPADAEAERKFAETLPMLSHVGVPLRVGGSWVCALLTATARRHRTWTDTDLAHVRIIGQILANAVHRRRLERELGETLSEVRRLQRRLEAENQYLREAIGSDLGFEQIAGRSRALREVLEQAAQVAPTAAAVLLQGETGTGKELLARAIHAHSKRGQRPLVMVNCAALPHSLVESELFGHEKGAFTGATSAKVGRFELADGGTLFLDEIAEIPTEVQAKLLRVLQDGEFERVGGTRTRKVDVRILAATNRDLERAIAEGRFREDLYYRLSVFPIQLPPLRERRDDIPLLVQELIQRRQDELDRRIERIPDEAMRALTSYAWPGNVRELGNVIERALILSRGPELNLDAFLASHGPRALPPAPSQRLDDVERAHFVAVLERCRWRITGPGNAADVLGMRPSTLRSRLKKLGVARPETPSH